jgi:hypothetical protein
MSTNLPRVLAAGIAVVFAIAGYFATPLLTRAVASGEPWLATLDLSAR